MHTTTFDARIQRNWKPVFEDPGTGDWREHWFLDGQRADVRNSADGMIFAAGPIAGDHASHAVLWTRQAFSGDVRIAFDFTRLDTISRFVNILYIQATGIGEGPYSEDIADWSHLRQIPYMGSYFNTMNLLHISYAAFGNDDDKDEDYVRARRYPTRPDRPFNATDLPPDNFLTGLFRPGKTYRFDCIKTDTDLFFDVRDKADGSGQRFHWPLQAVEPVTHGRIGIRHMWTRCSRYADIRIWQAS